MNAAEIRALPVDSDLTERSAVTYRNVILREIAAQLAELNEQLKPGNLIANVNVTDVPKIKFRFREM